MTVTVNGEKRTLPDGATVAALLSELGLGALPAAVEVNRRLVPKREHGARPLQEGDAVEVVTLVGGG
ncbi:MAG: sulfur carrier protein ThiS [Phycisphaerales bacterium]|nr:sulfur carrier protein ThiS [Phycisphaerales bacterium]